MLAGRGLHTAPYLSPEGYAYVVAVSRWHRLVAWRTVGPDDNLEAVKRELRLELDAADPITPLSYEAGSPAEARRSQPSG